MCFISTKNLIYKYRDNNRNAVDEVSINIKKGEFIAIIGSNGSGKSTFAKHINALYIPQYGDILVSGYNTKDNENLWNIRQKVGLVFQNPDNQMVASTVEEDVAFAPENMGFSSNEIKNKVDKALHYVKMQQYRNRITSALSGGQKQKVAIAGILSMEPECIVFDEATSMLDPIARNDIFNTVIELNKKYNITTIIITQFMNEAALANRIIVMDKGKIIIDGKPSSVFSNIEKLKSIHLDVPVVFEISNNLYNKGFHFLKNVLSVDDFINLIIKNNKINLSYNFYNKHDYYKKDVKMKKSNQKILEAKNVSYIFNKGSVFENQALYDINFCINKGEFISIIGHTGSGKTTLIQTLNAIITPTSGDIYYYGENINLNHKYFRQKIGLVFQYPEHQLFEETVFKDVSFGPINMGLDDKEIKRRVIKSLNDVGIDESFYDKSPFELSGGEKRKVAIAGILAMRPEILILDEPTAGLDPFSTKEILNNIKEINKKDDVTVILVSHSMEQAAELSDRIFVMNNGKLIVSDYTDNIFSNSTDIEKMDIILPQTALIFKRLNDIGIHLPTNIYTIEKAVEILSDFLR